jgi:hypothetical protein
VQKEGEVIFTSDVEIEKEMKEMKEIEKNLSLQIKSCKIPKLNEKIFKLNKQRIGQILEQLHLHESLLLIVAFLTH